MTIFNSVSLPEGKTSISGISQQPAMFARGYYRLRLNTQSSPGYGDRFSSSPKVEMMDACGYPIFSQSGLAMEDLPDIYWGSILAYWQNAYFK